MCAFIMFIKIKPQAIKAVSDIRRHYWQSQNLRMGMGHGGTGFLTLIMKNRNVFNAFFFGQASIPLLISQENFLNFLLGKISEIAIVIPENNKFMETNSGLSFIQTYLMNQITISLSDRRIFIGNYLQKPVTFSFLLINQNRRRVPKFRRIFKMTLIFGDSHFRPSLKFISFAPKRRKQNPITGNRILAKFRQGFYLFTFHNLYLLTHKYHFILNKSFRVAK